MHVLDISDRFWDREVFFSQIVIYAVKSPFLLVKTVLNTRTNVSENREPPVQGARVVRGQVI